MRVRRSIYRKRHYITSPRPIFKARLLLCTCGQPTTGRQESRRRSTPLRVDKKPTVSTVAPPSSSRVKVLVLSSRSLDSSTNSEMLACCERHSHAATPQYNTGARRRAWWHKEKQGVRRATSSCSRCKKSRGGRRACDTSEAASYTKWATIAGCDLV